MIVFIDLLKLNGVLGGGWVAAVAECWQMSHPTWMASENSARHNVENSNNNNHQTESTTRNLFGSLSALLTQHQAGNDLHWLSGPQRPNVAAFVCSKKIIRADVYLLPVTRPILSFWLNKITNYRKPPRGEVEKSCARAASCRPTGATDRFGVALPVVTAATPSL